MKRSRYIYLLICLTVALTIYKLSTTTTTDSNNLNICKKDYKIRGASLQFNYRGLSLTSNSADEKDFVLCPGDFFGDLHNTYVMVEDCNLAMYHQGNLIWSSNKIESYDANMACAISLQWDGNLVVSKEALTCFYPVKSIPYFWPAWDSKTNFKPNKTEMKIQGQQLQIIQTFFKDGTQRLFYTGEGLRGFQEDLGPPKQIAKKFLIVNHTDGDGVILRRNEYIGDLNGLHLIFQTNCDLQLKNFSQAIWSFAAYFTHGKECTLRVEGNSIGIPIIPGLDEQEEGMNILPSHDFTVIQSNITFFGDQLLIIQTLNNGSHLLFYSEPGQDNGLKLKREGKQIARNNITISSEITFQRMDYIGDLQGLHLVLQDDCVFKLANGKQELWKLRKNDFNVKYSRKKLGDGPFMECSIQFNPFHV